MLLDLADASLEQHELNLDDPPEDRGSLMTAMDRLNRRYGRGTVVVGTAGTPRPNRRWMMKQELKTPNYTTDWNELPVVRA